MFSDHNEKNGWANNALDERPSFTSEMCLYCNEISLNKLSHFNVGHVRSIIINWLTVKWTENIPKILIGQVITERFGFASPFLFMVENKANWKEIPDTRVKTVHFYSTEQRNAGNGTKGLRNRELYFCIHKVIRTAAYKGQTKITNCWNDKQRVSSERCESSGSISIKILISRVAESLSRFIGWKFVWCSGLKGCTSQLMMYSCRAHCFETSAAAHSAAPAAARYQLICETLCFVTYMSKLCYTTVNFYRGIKCSLFIRRFKVTKWKSGGRCTTASHKRETGERAERVFRTMW